MDFLAYSHPARENPLEIVCKILLVSRWWKNETDDLDGVGGRVTQRYPEITQFGYL